MPQPCLVDRRHVGGEKADRDRFIATSLKRRHKRQRNLGLIERRNDRTCGIEPLGDLKAILPPNGRHRLCITQVINVAAIVTLEKQDIPEPTCRHECNPGAFALQDGVRRDRRAVNEIGNDGGIETGCLERSKGTLVWIGRRARHLDDFDATPVHRDKIGESTPDFYTNPHRTHLYANF